MRKRPLIEVTELKRPKTESFAEPVVLTDHKPRSRAIQKKGKLGALLTP